MLGNEPIVVLVDGYSASASEIVTGALNTVEAGQFVVIESTAEGQEGPFYEMTQRARTRAVLGESLTPLDYRFHFFPWWQEESYVLDDHSVVIGAEDQRYFERLEAARSDIPGTGMGLPICKRIVESLHGSITLEGPSEGMASGTTVRISFPAETVRTWTDVVQPQKETVR